MMFRLKNEEPVFYEHECPEYRRGKIMTAEELHDFAVQVLINEYGGSKAEVKKYEKNNAFEPDFCFVNNCGGNSFSAGVSAKKKINVLVVCKDELDGDISDIDTTWLVDEYRRNNIIPRITFASAWCVSDNDDGKGKPAVCGGTFCFKYYSVSVLPDEENIAMDKELSPVELAVKYAEAWKEYDASIVEPYLDKDFHYASDWVFDEMPCRAEYMYYFTEKLKRIKERNVNLEVCLGRNHQTEQVCLIMNDGELSALVLETKDGRIISARMQEYSAKFKPFAPEDELYMNHGDHLDTIMPAHLLIKDYLQDIIEESRVWRKTRTQVTTDEIYEERTDVVSLMFDEGDMKMQTIMAYDPKHNANMFLSLYPVCDGEPVYVFINKIIEWDNQLEATVFCSYGEIEFAFFAVDYYCNKHKYVEGQSIMVDLAALAMKAGEARRGFTFEGQQAVDWLAKTGGTPNYDDNGNVEPVRFSMENMVAYLNTDSKCPDEAEFQSPVGRIHNTSLLGVDFFKTMIYIGRRHSYEGEIEVSVPLYFRRDFFPNIKEGDPVSGILWLTGSIAGQHKEGEDYIEADNRLGEMAAEFESYIEDCDFKAFDNIMFVLDKLPLLRIRDGYELDAFQKGDSHGWAFQPYCCKVASTERYLSSEHDKYDDRMYIQGRISWSEAESVPDHMNYFEFPFTEEGIMQAWMLKNIADFMPRFWHACYGSKTYVFDTERIERLFAYGSSNDRMKVSKQVLALDLESLLPKVSICCNHATLEYAYWNDWRGLVKITVEADKYEGEKVRFGEPIEKVLVEYRSRLRF